MLFIAFLTLLPLLAYTAEVNVSIPWPAFAKVENGTGPVTFCCYSQLIEALLWLNIPSDDRFTVAAAENASECLSSDYNYVSQLTIHPVYSLDASIYTCYDENNAADHANCTLEVYLMPSYVTQSAIILVVNVLLFITFFACYTASRVQEKREMQHKGSRSLATGTKI
jgi:hypothetical protein